MGEANAIGPTSVAGSFVLVLHYSWSSVTSRIDCELAVLKFGIEQTLIC